LTTGVRAEPPRAVAPFDAATARAHQEAWARHLETTVETTNALGMKFVLIPPGEFFMGSSDEEVERALAAATEQKVGGTDKRIIVTEAPKHRVVLTKPYRLSATEVTVGRFRRFVKSSGYVTETERLGGGNTHRRTAPTEYVFDPKISFEAPGYPVTDDSPVTQVTWNDATAFCRWLGDETKSVCRLPTEAEWEFACRAGTTTEFSCGDDLQTLHDYAWFRNEQNVGAGRVGTKAQNPFGLFDMHGNTREWCSDWYGAAWYKKSPTADPKGPATGTSRVLRGGKWRNQPTFLRSAYRFEFVPTYRSQFFGFRVVSEVAAH